MRRCKLISPTNLQLQQPILEPVEEAEFFLIGVKEYVRKTAETWAAGIIVGFGFAVLLLALFKVLAEHGAH